jgi:perosamine synthetase
MGRELSQCRRVRPSRLRRRLALLGGTTTVADLRVALRHLADPQSLVQGPSIAAYEQAFADRIGVRYASSFAAGRVGLYGILRALGIGAGDEVLLQVPTHIVVANAIRYTGAKPIYVDINLDTYNIDLAAAAERRSERTKAIVVQHTFGVPADLDGALELANRHGLALIEDCVHALGSTYGGRQIGSFGRAAFFSTEETKTVSTTMGGMVVTDDPELASAMRSFQERCAWPSVSLSARFLLKLVLWHGLMEPRVHRFSRTAYEFVGERHPLPRPTVNEELRGVQPIRYEQRLSNGQAAVGLEQLRQLETNLRHRRRVSDAYRNHLSTLGIRTPVVPEGAEAAFVRYPVWVEDREAVERAAAPHAVLGTWFTSVLEEALTPAHGDYEEGSCPRAEAAARHLVNLPTHPRVDDGDVDAMLVTLSGATDPKLA